MSDNREEWTDAELAAHCRDGDEFALTRLAALYIPALAQCIALSRHHRGHVTVEVIEDAAQEVFYRICEAGDHILANFQPTAKTLAQFLALLMFRQVEEFLRQERLEHCRRQHVDTDSDERRSGPGPQEERAEQITADLSPAQRAFLQALLTRTFADDPDKPSPEAVRQMARRIRLKVQELLRQSGETFSEKS